MFASVYEALGLIPAGRQLDVVVYAFNLNTKEVDVEDPEFTTFSSIPA